MNDNPGIDQQTPPSGTGCAECLAASTGGWWFHLRRCAQCGHVGCCDQSPGQHARLHHQETGHRLIQSFEPGEDWYWDFETNDYYEGPRLAAPHHHPADQPTPGPAGAVPENWTELLNS